MTMLSRSTLALIASCAVAVALAAAAPAMASPDGAGQSRPAPPTAYVVNEGGLQVPGTVTPIDTASGVAGAPIKVGGVPFTIAITPNGKTAYVTDISRNVVTPITTATNKPGKPIKVGDGPFSLAITPNGKMVYVANDDSGTVTPISTSANKAGRAIAVAAYPIPIAAAANGKTVYSVGATQLSAISTATNKASRPLGIGGGIHAIAISPSSKTVYVTNGNSLLRINATTLQVTKRITVGADWAVALTPNGATLYAFSCSDLHPATDSMTAISIATFRPAKPVRLGFCVAGTAFTPNGKTMYIVDSPTGSKPGTVIPVNTATGKLGSPIVVGWQPGALAVLAGATASSASTLYVVNTGSDSVTAINTAANAATATIGVGYLPTSIGIAR